jgi:hypothetical protein
MLRKSVRHANHARADDVRASRQRPREMLDNVPIVGVEEAIVGG